MFEREIVVFENRLRAALRRELDRHYGSIGTIERELGHGDGFLRKLANGDWPLSVTRLSEASLALGIDPETFFTRALGIGDDPIAALELHETTKPNRSLRAIAAATRRLDTDAAGSWIDATTPTLWLPGAVDDERKALEALSISEHRRRLRNKRSLRHVSFVDPYLAYLDQQRLNEPVRPAAAFEVLATHVVPNLATEPRQRLELQCRALGGLAMCHLFHYRIGEAAFLMLRAMRVAERHRLTRTACWLLYRCASVLRDQTERRAALAAVNRASALAIEVDDRRMMNLLLLERGRFLAMLEDEEHGSELIGLACDRLDHDEWDAARVAGHHTLALQWSRIGRLEEAVHHLGRAAELTPPTPFAQSRVAWALAIVHYRLGDPKTATRMMEQATAAFRRSAPSAEAASVQPLDEALALVDQLYLSSLTGRTDVRPTIAVALTRAIEPLRRETPVARYLRAATRRLLEPSFDTRAAAELAIAAHTKALGTANMCCANEPLPPPHRLVTSRAVAGLR
ncbi:MAG: hypothetical protein AAGD38_03715 [Acidobacteriota bacterium]